MNNKKIELLAPAGDLEKLKIAITYGADAVYMGGTKMGLRAKAKNFTPEQMKEGIEFAHSYGAKVYVTCNIFAHNEDFDGMAEYFKSLYEMNVDAVLISDLGVFSVAREVAPNLNIHISTQANNTNYMTAKFWKSMGAERVVMARELSINEITEISEKTNNEIEIEAFVHGAMCISYSGRCLLSNYLNGRDANKGECSHPCRWKYFVVEETRPGEYMPIVEDERGSYIFNSKDLCMIDHIPDLVSAGIYSLKIEGRIKTSYYVGTIIKAYREAIDDYLTDPKLYESKKDYYIKKVQEASYRGFTTGFYYGKPNHNEQIYGTSAYIKNYDFIGMVLDYDEKEGIATIEQRNKFVVGDKVEFVRSKGENFFIEIDEMYDNNNLKISEAPHAQQIIKLKTPKPLAKFDMMRKEKIN